jgi:tetratricopeptide (TPR) repeat protein
VLAEPVPAWPQLAAIEELRPWIESSDLAGLARILDDARAIGHAPFIVEVAEALALRQAKHDAAAGIRTMRRTLALPLDDRSFGVATLVLARMLEPDPEDEVPKLVDAARPRVTAIGDVLLEARLDQVLANIAHARHRNDVAIAALERARRGFRIAYGEGGMQEATALIQLGLYQRDREPHGAQGKANYEAGREMFRRVGIPIPALQGTRDPEERVKESLEFLAFARKNGDQIAIVHAEYRAGSTFAVVGRREEGLAHYQAAIDLAREIGMRDASAVQIQVAAARLLNEMDRNAEAIPIARRAIERARELRVDESLADGLTELGQALIATRQVAAARAPLQESLKLRERLREAPLQRGITSFLCAIATWDVDRVRARELAHAASAATRSALDEVEDDVADAEQLRGILTRRLERIRRWIAAHP